MATWCFGCMRPKERHPFCEHCGFDERQNNRDHQLPTGTVVGGQYVLGKVLGQGGFGITYLAWDRIMNQRVAVKEYFPKGYASRTGGKARVSSYDGQDVHDFEHNKQRFLREAESLAKLWQVPQIIKILRYFEENGTAYIVMEYAEGMDLCAYLKKLKRPMTAEEAFSVLGPVVEALKAVHRAKLVHRDIAPDNIMVLADNSTKLLDFGAARYVENASPEHQRATSTQAILKNGFAPPEQYQSHGALGPWSDEYALCATVYYCLTEQIPPDAMSRMIDGTPINWNRIRVLSDRQLAALKKGMALQAMDRFPSIEELWAELKPEERESEDDPEIPETDEKKKQYHKRPLRKTGATIAAGMVLAAALGAAAHFGFKETSQPAETTAASAVVPASETTVLPETPALEIAPQLALDGVDLGYTQAIQVLSEHDSRDLQWSSSDPNIAAVSEDGTVTALGIGVAEITARYQDQQAVCAVSVDLNYNILCTFEENETGWTITGYEGEPEELPAYILLPQVYEERPVTAIGEAAFADCSRIEEIKIPDSVAAIGKKAFSGCSSLAGIRIPDGVACLSEYVFQNCASLVDVIIPDSVTTIENAAFYHCTGLTGITIPDSVNSIGEAVFLGCSSLTGITIPEGITAVKAAIFADCTSLAEVTLPDTVTSIEYSAFEGCKSLIGITLPDSLESISVGAFAACTSLTSIVIPDGVTAIDFQTFSGCSGLTEIIIPDSVTYISANVFSDCTSLTSIIIPDSVTAIEQFAFSRCTGLMEITLSKQLASIEPGVFLGCTGLRTISIPESVTVIENNAFDGCSSLTDVTIPKNVEFIYYEAFADCSSLANVILPDSLTYIGYGVFSECTSLTEITIPKGVNQIEHTMFSGCTSLADVTIPRSVEAIDSNAFSGCSSLARVTISRDCRVDKKAFPDSCTISYY